MYRGARKIIRRTEIKAQAKLIQTAQPFCVLFEREEKGIFNYKRNYPLFPHYQENLDIE